MGRGPTQLVDGNPMQRGTAKDSGQDQMVRIGLETAFEEDFELNANFSSFSRIKFEEHH